MSGICPACDGRSDDSLVCPRCIHTCATNLRAIPALMRELETTLTRQSQTGTGNGGKNSTRPLPFDAHASELAGEVKMCLVNWWRTFELGDGIPEDGIASICGWFLAREQRIRGHEEGAYFVDEIADVVRRVRQAIDLRPEMVYLGPCAKMVDQGEGAQGICGHQMYARKWEEAYDCPGEPGLHCGAIYNVEKRRNELLASAVDQSGTVGQCAYLLGMFGLPVKIDTVWNWVRPRVIRGVTYPPCAWSTGTNEKGENLYRVGDIEALARDSHATKEAKHRARVG